MDQKVALSSSAMVIMNNATGMVIDLSGGKPDPGTKVQLWSPNLKHKNTHKQWRFMNPAEGAGGVIWFHIVNVGSNTCIELEPRPGNNANIKDLDRYRAVANPIDKGKNSQQWRLINDATGGTVQWFRYSKNDGDPLQTYRARNGYQQGWILLPVTPSSSPSTADGPSEPSEL